MKRFASVTAPADWATRGLAAGVAWLDQSPLHRAKPRPLDLWSPFKHELAEGFANLCGYTAMYVPNGTVDHFIPWSTVKDTAEAWRAYEWTNFRYCDGWFNSARRGPVPDPFLVEDSWFELRLPSLELEATDAVPAAERAAVENVLRWLRRDRRVMKARLTWYQLYRSHGLTFAGLDQMAPLIAAALRRQPEFMLPADQTRLRSGDLAR